MKKWQLQEAKAKLSEVIQNTCFGPQEISVRGKTTAVVLSAKQYLELISPKSSFIKFLQDSPLFQSNIELTREVSNCREIEL